MTSKTATGVKSAGSMLPHLLRDVVRRRWWLFALAAVISTVPFPTKDNVLGTVAMVVAMGYGAMLLYIVEFLETRARKYAPLPVGRATLGRLLWIECLALFPGLYVCVNIPSYVIHRLMLATKPLDLLLYVCVAACILGGIAGLLLLQMAYVRVRGATVIRQTITGFFYNVLIVLWGAATLFFIGRLIVPTGEIAQIEGNTLMSAAFKSLYLFVGIRESTLDMQSSVALAVAVASIVASFLLSTRLAEAAFALQAGRRARAVAAPPTAPVFPSRLAGLAAVWVRAIAWLFTGGVMLTLGLGLCVAMAFAGGIGVRDFQREIAWGWVFAFLSVPAYYGLVLPWVGSIRSLRMLPMSRGRLILFLVSFPGLALILLVALVTVALRVWDGPQELGVFVRQALVLFATSLLGHVLFLRFDPLPSLVYVFTAYPAVMALEVSGLLSLPVVAVLATLTAAAGIYGMYRVIEGSSAVYRRRDAVEILPGQFFA